MPVAPTPPTKPTPPVPPTLTPTGSNPSDNTHTGSPANQAQTPSKPVNTEATGAVKQLEGLGKAFQGNSSPKNGEKPGAPDKPANQTQSIQTVPAQSAGAQAELSAETAVPAKPPVVESKSLGSGYYMFLVGSVVVVAIVLVGLRLFKNKRKNKQLCTAVDSSKQTAAVLNKEGIYIVAPPQAAAPEGEKHFEVRV